MSERKHGTNEASGARSYRVVAARSLIALTTLSVVALTVLHACTVANGLIVPQRDSGSEDAAPPDLCQHEFIPSPPQAQFDGEGVKLNFAFIGVTFGSVDAGSSQLGFNLDNACTCGPRPGFPANDVLGPESCVPLINDKTPHCDGVGGRDNALAQILSGIPSSVRFDSYITRLLVEGQGGLVFLLSSYNGSADDAKVSVGMLPSRGKFALIDAGPGGDAGGAIEAYDASSHRWSVDRTELTYFNSTLGTPIIVSTSAYVSNWKLVVQLSDKKSLPLVGLDMKLTNGYLVASIDHPDGGNLAVTSGVIVGRWDVKNMTEAVGHFVFSPIKGLPTSPLCTQPGLYEDSVKPNACRAADLTVNSDDDNKNRPCGAMSIAMGFTAETAELGDSVPVPIAPECPDGSTDLDCSKYNKDQ